MTHKILLVEDQIDLAKGLASNLSLEGYVVELCHDGALAINHIQALQPDLLILDMMLPHMDGFAIIEALQGRHIHVPTLCLTARATEMDKVRALRSGADDYLTKPFGLMELLARVEALLRRHPNKPHPSNPVTQLGHLSINQAAQQISTHGQLINLSPKEYQLLMYLYQHLGEAISRHELMQEVWGHQAAINSRTVDTHIAELRKKCQLHEQSTVQINTISKLGYQLCVSHLE